MQASCFFLVVWLDAQKLRSGSLHGTKNWDQVALEFHCQFFSGLHVSFPGYCMIQLHE